ncbi:Transcriptional regulator, Xre [Bacillus thuringiensis serovar pakistani str. T13001]|nr:Transcriptional regulator, Xre [Bacillus thuringiensis serovar pakistani str. T13001]
MHFQEDIVLKNFSKELIEFRKMYDISQKELCDGICHHSYVSSIENNKIKEGDSEIIRLLLERMKHLKATVNIQNDTIPNTNMGTFFLKERLKHGIIQETLCYGICNTSYLSKIENNKLTPSSKIIKLLYQRLKEIKNDTKNEELEILELEKLYDTMLSLFDKKRMNEAKKVLHKGLQSTQNKVQRLYYLFLYQQYFHFDYKNLKTFLETEAIPFFQKQGNNKQLSIFYIDLATIYYQENQFKKACLYYQKGISGIGIVKNMHVVTSDKKVQVKFP